MSPISSKPPGRPSPAPFAQNSAHSEDPPAASTSRPYNRESTEASTDSFEADKPRASQRRREHPREFRFGPSPMPTSYAGTNLPLRHQPLSRAQLDRTRRSASPVRRRQTEVDEQRTIEVQEAGLATSPPEGPEAGVILKNGEIVNRNARWRIGDDYWDHLLTHPELRTPTRRRQAVNLANSPADEEHPALIYTTSYNDPNNHRNNRRAGNRLRVDTTRFVAAIVTPFNLILSFFDVRNPRNYIEQNRADDASRREQLSRTAEAAELRNMNIHSNQED